MSQRQSQVRSRRWLLLAGLVIATLLIGVTAVVVQRGQGAVGQFSTQLALLRLADDQSVTLYEWAGDDARAIIGRLRGLALPTDARDIRLARQGDVRPHYWLRLSLSAASLDALIASTCLPPLASGDLPAFDYGRSPDIVVRLPWWQPDQLARPTGAACVADGGIAFRMAANGGETTTVYLEIAPAER